QFVSDYARTELENFGLAPPELELALAQGTNTVAFLQFGKSPTNDAAQVYSRRFGQNTVFTVAKDLQEPWRAASVNDFRDPRLLTLSDPVETIEIHGQDSFSVQSQTNNTWRVLPGDFPADKTFVTEFLSTLSNLKIADFVKEVVNPADLQNYGLAAPGSEYILKPDCSTAAASETNKPFVHLSFVTSTND